MHSFRFQKLCGPIIMLAIVVLCCFVSVSSAGTYVGNNTPTTVNSYPYPPANTYRNAEARGGHDHNARSLLIKSLILAPLAMVVLILLLVLLIPIPVISSPLGRSFSSATSSLLPTMQMARNVFTAEECVERVSCELSRMSKSYNYTSWIPQAVEQLLTKGKWVDRVSRGLKQAPNHCVQFTCSPAKTIKRSFKLE
ncbi:hypothetical protein Ocin01_04737 [Orchesella cincta]|uniref:Uncharacterized protein n=1 Tax=Orchesella cincta TaxID=48709 RepID=A0A1D2NAE0_ORCCI|nr:hypothetical protein Ocin01_04737 [Orchesella cincta]